MRKMLLLTDKDLRLYKVTLYVPEKEHYPAHAPLGSRVRASSWVTCFLVLYSIKPTQTNLTEPIYIAQPRVCQGLSDVATYR